MSQGAKRRLSRLVLFVENKVFPLVFVYFAFVHVNVLLGYHSQIATFFRTFWLDGVDRNDVNTILFVLLRVLMIVLYAVYAYGLATRTRTEHEFDDWREVGIPVLCCFYGLIANALIYSHARITVMLVPPRLASAFNSAGIAVVLVGSVLSVVATWQLRRSFSVYVESQPVVDRGVYSVMRHPIYVGHGLRLIGYCMMSGFLLYAVVSLGAIVLLVYRAALEERKLTATEPEYRMYRPSLRAMGRSWRPAALAALFLYGLLPLETKAAAISLITTGVPAVSARAAREQLSRPLVEPRHRPARLARVEAKRLGVMALGEAPAVPLPARRRRLADRFQRPLLLAAEGYSRFLGRERAPPA